MPRIAIAIVGCLLAGCLGPTRIPNAAEVATYTPDEFESLAVEEIRYTPRELLGEAADESNAPLPEDIHKIAMEGIKAYEFKLSVLVDNLANAQTVGFKRRRVLIQESTERPTESSWDDEQETDSPSRGSCGEGCRVARVVVDHAQGALQQTGRNLDLAIAGRGYFSVTDPESGDTLYTRAGHLDINVDGELLVANGKRGFILEQPITIPADAVEISIHQDGSVAVRQPGSDALTSVGQLRLAVFANGSGLQRLGDGLYAATDASGPPAMDVPDSSGMGKIRQGCLEASNVNPLDEQRRIEECRLMLRRLHRLLPPELADVE